MEKGDLKQNFEQGLETLGDLYSLGDSSLYPLFDRLHFHFNEINSFQERSKRVDEFKTLRGLFLKNLNDNVMNFFRGHGRGVKIDLVDLMENPDLDTLDHLSAAFPLAGEVCRLFSFQKAIKITLNNDSFSFKGKVPFDLDLEALREETYRLTRVFLKNRILFTFKIFESSRDEGLFELEFDFHMENRSSAPHIIPVDEGHVLSFSGVLKSFQRERADVEKLGEHSVFLLDENFEVNKLDRNTFMNSYRDNCYELFHFPFLFRPISLIIKRSIYGGKESIDDFRLMPLQEGKPLEVLNIDLFEIFQK